MLGFDGSSHRRTRMDFTPIAEHFELYLSGLLITLQLLGLALLMGTALAIPLAVLRAAKHPAIHFLPWFFIWFFRGTPLLIQIYMIYFGLPQFEFIRETPWLWAIFKHAYWCAALGFTLNTAAYTAQILYGALLQLPVGEIEAAHASGMSPWRVKWHIELPAAARRALPAYGNEVIFTLHGTAVAGVITVVDLFGAAKIVNARYFLPFEAFTMAGVIYLCLTLLIVFVMRQWEARCSGHLR